MLFVAILHMAAENSFFQYVEILLEAGLIQIWPMMLRVDLICLLIVTAEGQLFTWQPRKATQKL